MSKILEQCKEILAHRTRNDTNSIRTLVVQVAERLNYKLSRQQLDRAVVYLKYGCAIW